MPNTRDTKERASQNFVSALSNPQAGSLFSPESAARIITAFLMQQPLRQGALIGQAANKASALGATQGAGFGYPFTLGDQFVTSAQAGAITPNLGDLMISGGQARDYPNPEPGVVGEDMLFRILRGSLGDMGFIQ